MHTSAIALLLVGTGLASACTHGDPAAPPIAPEPVAAAPPAAVAAPDPPGAAPAAAPAAEPGPFDARLLEIARDYGQWTKVKPVLDWAPTDCAAPMPPSNGLRASASKDEATHGQKLYYLFARDPAAYPPRGPAPAGQAIVKEAWTPVLVPPDELRVQGDVAVRDGQRYRAGARAALFVMMKLAPDTEGTDHGWVYGVVSPDGARVEAAGRLDNCVACHTQAPGDRLFGPPL